MNPNGHAVERRPIPEVDAMPRTKQLSIEGRTRQPAWRREERAPARLGERSVRPLVPAALREHLPRRV